MGERLIGQARSHCVALDAALMWNNKTMTRKDELSDIAEKAIADGFPIRQMPEGKRANQKFSSSRLTKRGPTIGKLNMARHAHHHSNRRRRG